MQPQLVGQIRLSRRRDYNISISVLTKYRVSILTNTVQSPVRLNRDTIYPTVYRMDS